MTLGTLWNEDLPLYRSAQRRIRLMDKMAPDRYRFVLDRPLAQPRASRWTYNGGCHGPGPPDRGGGVGKPKPLLDYARAKALRPSRHRRAPRWTSGSNGEAVSAASGPAPAPPANSSKLGQLVLELRAPGRAQLVPARLALTQPSRPSRPTWVEEGLRLRLPVVARLRLEARNGQPWVAGFRQWRSARHPPSPCLFTWSS